MEVKNFITGMLIYILHKMKLTGADFNGVYEQRKDACSECPLRSGLFCSKNKMVKTPAKDHSHHPTGVIVGCGCFLPAKRSTHSKCPLKKWEYYN